MAEPACHLCDRGREACQWCHDIAFRDFDTVCDCGLADFGAHLPLWRCHLREPFRWVIAHDEAAALELRPRIGEAP